MASLQESQPYVPTKAWWKEAVVYQIYPISFFDSNGDGLGDLRGIHAKLDYLKSLGVDVLWLSPIYRSPLADMGYDISDYRDIDPRYGTLQDWDDLLKGVHERGMKLMMDLVINHTSDEHEWFKQSRSSKSDPKRDWYVWRPPKYDEQGNRQPPNNWRSAFQGPAWDFDEATGEYYLHIYVTKQPDLNWENPEVHEAAWDVMRFWIDRGCDGFRMDVINLLSKEDGLPDAPITDLGEASQPASMYFANGPRVHEYIREMHSKVLSKHDLITVGETPFTYDAEPLADYVLPANKELNMVFHFEIMDLDSPKGGHDYDALRFKPWALDDLKGIISRWQTFHREDGYWNAVFIENHDHSRVVSRFGNDSDEWRAISAKMLAILQVGQGGTQFVYQGQELGLKNFPRSWGIEEYKDVASINYWNRILAQRRASTGLDEPDMSDVLDGFQKKARDHSRVPMQWDSTSNAGFTQGTPWMRVNEDYKVWNAAAQLTDAASVLAFWKKALATRKQYEVLIYGDFRDVSVNSPTVFMFTRTLPGSKTGTKALIALNFDTSPVEVYIPVEEGARKYELVLSNYEVETPTLVPEPGAVLHLQGYEGRVYIRA
ncbi:glycoside hydrolase family 13 protein [Pholiota conissans]|uniref:Alpha-glucosidase n=1 Tax=Pholiota conissans TaxID=109636 RepID=A0A9P5ZA67_9AGAR|nr:glycoside hydrolase family 13 protein [Pholiota conissans]